MYPDTQFPAPETVPHTKSLRKWFRSISISQFTQQLTVAITKRRQVISVYKQASKHAVCAINFEQQKMSLWKRVIDLQMIVSLLMDNKIKMLHFLKRNHTSSFQLEHVLAMLLENSVSFIELRRFLKHHYPQTQMRWDELEDKQLLSLAKEAQTYIHLNLEEWKREYQRYLSQKDELRQRRQRVSVILSINSSLSNVQMRQTLKNIVPDRESLVSLHRNSEKITQIEAQNRQITQMLELLEAQISYEIKNESFWNQTDEQMSLKVKQIAKKFDIKLEQQQSVQDEVEKKMVQKGLQEYNRKLLVMKKRLYQIFLYYCRQNNLLHLTFEQYNKSMKQIDLKLFLKYFKDYKFTQFNKYRFKVHSVTLMFRAQANNGLFLDFQHFWNIHKQLFQMRDLNITQLDILTATHSKLEEFKLSIQEEIHKFQQFSEVVNEAITKQILQLASFRNVQTQANAQQTIQKSQSSVIIRKKVFNQANSQNLSKKAGNMQSSLSSIYYQKSSLSSKGLYEISKRPNMIQQTRKLILNEQQTNLVNSNIKRSDSLWSQNSELKRSKIEASLPKILKITNEEISNQGIYKSLKRFANFEYVAQEKKLKELIGVAMGEDTKFLQVLLKKQMEEKQQKQRERQEQKQQRRKKLIEVIAKKQHSHCKRYHPQEVEPYMRF